MFFVESRESRIERKRLFANETVEKFCKLAMMESLRLETRLKSIRMVLTCFDDFLHHFADKKNNLQKSQEILQAQALERNNHLAFATSTAMNSIIFYLDNRGGDAEQREFFIESIRSAILTLQERQTELLKQVPETQIEPPGPKV